MARPWLALLGPGARQGRVVGQVDVVGGLVAVLHHEAERAGAEEPVAPADAPGGLRRHEPAGVGVARDLGVPAHDLVILRVRGPVVCVGHRELARQHAPTTAGPVPKPPSVFPYPASPTRAIRPEVYRPFICTWAIASR